MTRWQVSCVDEGVFWLEVIQIFGLIYREDIGQGVVVHLVVQNSVPAFELIEKARFLRDLLILLCQEADPSFEFRDSFLCRHEFGALTYRQESKQIAS
jgi:hypothetical protein